jgi:hypothetical protein
VGTVRYRSETIDNKNVGSCVSYTVRADFTWGEGKLSQYHPVHQEYDSRRELNPSLPSEKPYSISLICRKRETVRSASRTNPVLTSVGRPNGHSDWLQAGRPTSSPGGVSNPHFSISSRPGLWGPANLLSNGPGREAHGSTSRSREPRSIHPLAARLHGGMLA